MTSTTTRPHRQVPSPDQIRKRFEDFRRGLNLEGRKVFDKMRPEARIDFINWYATKKG